MVRKRWHELSPRTRRLIVVGGVLEGALKAVALVDLARRPAVLVGPEGTGLDDFQRQRADALAELGYVAPAVDIHGGHWFTDPQHADPSLIDGAPTPGLRR
jgi:dienelactone hydrolase